MNEAEIKAESRLIAIEYLVVNAYYLIARSSGESFEIARQRALAGLERLTFQGEDPALGDLWAAELHDAVSRLLSAVPRTGQEG